MMKKIYSNQRLSAFIIAYCLPNYLHQFRQEAVGFFRRTHRDPKRIPKPWMGEVSYQNPVFFEIFVDRFSRGFSRPLGHEEVGLAFGHRKSQGPQGAA